MKVKNKMGNRHKVIKILNTNNLLRKFISIIVNKIRDVLYKPKLIVKSVFWRNYANYSQKRKNEYTKNILIVKTDAIGDFIIFTRYLQSYIDLYKEYKIDLLISKVNYEIAKDCEKINRIIIINDKAISKFKLIKNIINCNYDKVIYPVNSREAAIDQICIFSNAKEIITFSGDNCNIVNSKKIADNKYFSTVINSDSNLKHETTRNEELLNKLGYAGNSFKSFIKIQQENINFLYYYIKKDEKYVVMVPGCQDLIRFWNEKKYAEIIEYICNIKKIKVIILGTSSEFDLIISILSKVVINDKKLLINLVEKTDLHNMLTIISKAFFYIGSETSASHIAELYSIKSICIMGGGHYSRFYPYPNSNLDYPVTVYKKCFYCNWECIYDEAKCIKEVTVEHIKKIINTIIEG